MLYWYGVYEQRRITDSPELMSVYFADFPESVRVAAAERLAIGVDENLSRHGIGRYPVGKVKSDVRRGLDFARRLS